MVNTPEQQWKQAIQDYRKKCQQIMKISSSIRYAGAINEYGRTLSGVIKPNVTPLLKSEQAKNEFFIVSTLITLRNSQASSIGSLEHVLFKHKKVTMIIIPHKKITYYITVNNKTKTIDNLILEIKKIL